MRKKEMLQTYTISYQVNWTCIRIILLALLLFLWIENLWYCKLFPCWKGFINWAFELEVAGYLGKLNINIFLLEFFCFFHQLRPLWVIGTADLLLARKIFPSSRDVRWSTRKMRSLRADIWMVNQTSNANWRLWGRAIPFKK